VWVVERVYRSPGSRGAFRACSWCEDVAAPSLQIEIENRPAEDVSIAVVYRKRIIQPRA